MEYDFKPTPLLRKSLGVHGLGTEGTWTPTLTFDNVSSGVEYNTRTGYFWKIGSYVQAVCEVHAGELGGATGTVRVEGLPYSAHSFGGSIPAPTNRVGLWDGLVSGVWTDISVEIPYSTSSQAIFYGMQGASTENRFVQITKSHVSTNFRVQFSVDYFTLQT